MVALVTDWFVIVTFLCSARGSYFISTNKLKPFAKGRLASNGDVLQQFWSFLFPRNAGNSEQMN